MGILDGKKEDELREVEGEEDQGGGEIGPIQWQERGRKWQERLLLTVAAVETAGGAGHNLHANG